MSTSGPPRFKDDPEAIRELGGDLSDEARLLSEHDLGAMEAGLKAKIASGATGAASGVSAGAVATGVAVALFAAGSAYVLLRSPAAAPDSPRPAIEVAETSRAVASPLPEVAEDVPAFAPQEDHGEEAEKPKTAPRKRSARGSATTRDVAPRADRPVAEPPIVAPAPEPASSLAAELADYEVGRRALRAGRFEEAAAAFEGYRARFAEGRLRHEAAVGLLESRFRAGQHAQAAAIAAEVERVLLGRSRGDSGSGGHTSVRDRAEVWRLVGETYALTGACPEAERALNRARALSAESTPDRMVARALEDCRRASP